MGGLTETGKPAQFYQYNEMNELRRVTAGTQETEYTYDDAGNLAGKEGFVGGSPATSCSYTFDGANRLREATISSTPAAYWYDQDGRRVKETVAGKTTWFLYDGLSVIAEFSDDKEPDSVIVPGVSRTRLDLHEPLTEYYLLDGLGSVAQLTDELGNITQEYFYDVFGAARNVKRDPFNRYRFVGLASDDLTGLIYMNARWYEPGTGRFGGRDPECARIGESQTVNRYAYVANNPIGRTDRTGRTPPGSMSPMDPGGADDDVQAYVENEDPSEDQEPTSLPTTYVPPPSDDPPADEGSGRYVFVGVLAGRTAQAAEPLESGEGRYWREDPPSRLKRYKCGGEWKPVSVRFESARAPQAWFRGTNCYITWLCRLCDGTPQGRPVETYAHNTGGPCRAPDPGGAKGCP